MMSINRCYRCRRFVAPRDSTVVRLLDTFVYVTDDQTDQQIEEVYEGRIVATDQDCLGFMMRPADPGPHPVCDRCRDAMGPFLCGYHWKETHAD